MQLFVRIRSGFMSTGPQWPTTITGWAIWIVIVIAICAAVYVMSIVAGIAIPWWVQTLLWICVAAAVIVGVIRFLAKLGNNP
jgi:hypothetical protein